MTNFIFEQALPLSLVAGLVGLAAAWALITWIKAQPDGDDRMREVAAAIQEGAAAYLHRQLQAVSGIALLLFAAICYFKNLPTGIGFIVGAACSLIAGFAGMRIAVMANVRTAQAATISRTAALRNAFNGGAVTGLLVVALALLSIGAFYMIASKYLGLRAAIDSLTGLALGASLVSVFARLGGGIYTKAADVGADLVGKIESKLEEDDPRNPATIADNVGDNVGDCAGMAADVFET
jgi:K(+)-stimulated pyrophosphate-energized sodium pump